MEKACCPDCGSEDFIIAADLEGALLVGPVDKITGELFPNRFIGLDISHKLRNQSGIRCYECQSRKVENIQPQKSLFPGYNHSVWKTIKVDEKKLLHLLKALEEIEEYIIFDHLKEKLHHVKDIISDLWKGDDKSGRVKVLSVIVLDNLINELEIRWKKE